MKVAVLFVISCFIAAAYSNSISIRGIQEGKMVADGTEKVCRCTKDECTLSSGIYKCFGEDVCRCNSGTTDYCECTERYCAEIGDTLSCVSNKGACKCTA
uniref:Uncharacterized protein n=1 Tax=Amphimedon queenslandica TaxID=400682 RepID=A0A1X7UMU0_AMPQE